MLSRTLSYISHHAIAILALICSLLALAGASYAAINLPKNSVGNTQIKRGAVTPPKFSKQVGGYVRMYAKISQTGKLEYSHPRAKLVGWRQSTTAPSGGLIEWRAASSNRCIALSTAQDYVSARVATNATIVSGASPQYRTGVSVQMAGPSGVSVAVIC